MLMPDLATIALLVVGLALAHGANARIARLIAEDDITAPWRARLVKRYEGKVFNLRLWPWKKKLRFNKELIARWAHCPWCCGWWTAWLFTAVAWFPIMGTQLWGWFFLAQWSVAHAAGRLNHDHGHK